MLRILIIDDYPMLLETLRMALGEEYLITTAGSGQEALVLVGKSKPDLVITDYSMQHMTGLELIHILRQISNPPKIILYSACLTNDIISRALQLGASACIAKPFDLFELKQLIQQLLGNDIGK